MKFSYKKIFYFLVIINFILNFSILNVKAESKIKLISPTKSALTKFDVMLLIGECNEADSVDVLINNKETKKIKVIKNTFYEKINLSKGKNNLKVTAYSKGNKVEDVDINIFYTEKMDSANNPKEFLPFYFHTMLVEDGDCNVCHDLKISVDKYELKKGERGLCFNCHDERLDVKFVHGPVAGGACLACHNPHGSPNEYTVRFPGDKLCFFCHEEDRMKSDHVSKLKDEEAKKQCVECHDVHGNNKEFFLKY